MNKFDRLMLDYYRVLNNAWSDQVREVATKAIRMLADIPKSGRNSERVVGDIEQYINQSLGEEFATRVAAPTKKFIETSLGLGLGDARSQVGLSIGLWGIKDERLAQIANSQQIFWVGSHYSADVSVGINNVLSQGVRDGWTIERLADSLRSAFSDTIKKGAPYWQGLAEHTALRIREFGRLQGYRKAGAQSYRLRVIIDDRTSDICRALAAENKIYPLEPATEVMDKLMAIDTSSRDLDQVRDYIKALAPWVSDNQVVYDGDRPVGVSGAHTPFPPFHWKCRTETEIVTE